MRLRARFLYATVTIKFMRQVLQSKHGSYLSVYANLIKLQVKKGDKVSTGQSLGRIATVADGATVLKLQIWKNTSRQNPKYWLRRK